MATSLRMISAVLLHRVSYDKFQYAIKLLTYLKRVKGKHDKGKCINVLLCCMHLLSPVIGIFAIVITGSQEKKLSMIVKNFVSLGFILQIDNMFSSCLPIDIQQCVDKINDKGGLKMPKDKNTYT